jgi:hypothetical protein
MLAHASSKALQMTFSVSGAVCAPGKDFGDPHAPSGLSLLSRLPIMSATVFCFKQLACRTCGFFGRVK